MCRKQQLNCSPSTWGVCYEVLATKHLTGEIEESSDDWKREQKPDKEAWRASLGVTIQDIKP
jgi:hypothetical protein